MTLVTDADVSCTILVKMVIPPVKASNKKAENTKISKGIISCLRTKLFDCRFVAIASPLFFSYYCIMSSLNEDVNYVFLKKKEQIDCQS